MSLFVSLCIGHILLTNRKLKRVKNKNMKIDLEKIHRLIFVVSISVYFYVVITFMIKKGVLEQIGKHLEADLVLLLLNVFIVFLLHKISGVIAKILVKDKKSDY
jgi:hypothetical protein